jgi:hypothetical protein
MRNLGVSMTGERSVPAGTLGIDSDVAWPMAQPTRMVPGCQRPAPSPLRPTATSLSVLELLNIFPLHSEIDQLRKSPYMICDSCRHHGRPMHPFSSVLVYSSHQTFMRLNEMRYSEIDIVRV